MGGELASHGGPALSRKELCDAVPAAISTSPLLSRGGIPLATFTMAPVQDDLDVRRVPPLLDNGSVQRWLGPGDDDQYRGRSSGFVQPSALGGVAIPAMIGGSVANHDCLNAAFLKRSISRRHRQRLKLPLPVAPVASRTTPVILWVLTKAWLHALQQPATDRHPRAGRPAGHRPRAARSRADLAAPPAQGLLRCAGG